MPIIPKIKEKLNNVQALFEKFNKIYIDYILCITFLNLIILKINQILFQISSFYLYPIIILVAILFRNQWFVLADKIKNTYLFNYLLYYFLIFKNNIYGLIFEYFEFMNELKYQRFLVFLTGFVLSSWSLNIIFYILNYSYNLSILFFFILLIINIFNLIEKKLIFTSENKNKDLDYNFIKDLLKINNLKFTKNKPLFYIQKRYIHVNEIKNLVKKYRVIVLISVIAGSLFTSCLQYSSMKVHKEQFEITKKKLDCRKEELELYQKQFEFQKEMEKRKMDYDLLEKQEKRLSAYDDKIWNLNREIHKLKIDMDTRHFWNRVDFSGTIEDLRNQEKILNCQRALLEEEINSNKKNFDINKIDDNSSLDD